MVSNYPKSMGLPTIFDITCKSNSKQIRESTDLPVCKYLLSTENGAILLMQQSRLQINFYSNYYFILFGNI